MRLSHKPSGGGPAGAVRLSREPWRWVGLAGAVLLAVAGWTAGARAHHNPVGVLPTPAALAHHPGQAAGLACWLVGTALLVFAWVRLRSSELPVRWVLVTAGLWALPLILAPALASRDIFAYAAQGDLYAHGMDPYQVGPSALPSRWLSEMSPSWRDTTTPYGPLVLLVARLVVMVSGGNLAVALVLLRLAAVLGLLLVAGYLPRLARAAGVDPGRAAWLGLASPLLLVHLVSGAHNDAIMIGLLVAGLAYAAERRKLLAGALPAGALLGLAGASKITALVVVPFAVALVAGRLDGRYRFVRAAGAVLAAMVAAFAVVTVVSGLGFGWVSGLADTRASVQWTSIPTGVGMTLATLLKAAGLPGAGAAVAACQNVALYLVLPVVLVVLWWPVRTGGPGGAVRPVVARAGWALAAFVLCSPTVHPWYLLWPAAVLAAGLARPGTAVQRVITVVLAALPFLTLPDGYNLARFTAVVGAPLDVAITVAFVVVGVRAGRRWLRGRGGPDTPTATGS